MHARVLVLVWAWPMALMHEGRRPESPPENPASDVGFN